MSWFSDWQYSNVLSIPSETLESQSTNKLAYCSVHKQRNFECCLWRHYSSKFQCRVWTFFLQEYFWASPMLTWDTCQPTHTNTLAMVSSFKFCGKDMPFLILHHWLFVLSQDISESRSVRTNILAFQTWEDFYHKNLTSFVFLHSFADMPWGQLNSILGESKVTLWVYLPKPGTISSSILIEIPCFCKNMEFFNWFLVTW